MVKLGGKDEAIEHACGANERHGLRRTRADVRRSIELMLTKLAHKTYTDREIGRRVKCTHPTVATVRSELIALGKIYQEEDGKRTSVRDGREVVRDVSVYRDRAKLTPEVPENQPEGTVGHTHGATSNLTLEESPDGTGLGEGVDPDGGVAGDGAGVAGPESPGEGDAKGDDAQKAAPGYALPRKVTWPSRPTFPGTLRRGQDRTRTRARVRVLSPTATRCLGEPQCVARPGCSVMPLAGRCVVRAASGQQCPGFRLSARLIQVLASPAPSAAR